MSSLTEIIETSVNGDRGAYVSRVTHVTYPFKYVVVTGDLIVGFSLYGTFDGRTQADSWAEANLKPGVPFQIIPVSVVDRKLS